MKVSIIIPYNKDRGGLHQAVESCKDQDDFILDEDYEIIAHYGDCGVSKNINDAVKYARGEFIKLCGEDDLLTTNCLYSLYTKIIEGYDIVCANAIKISPEPKHRGYWNSSIPETIHDLAMNNTIHGGTVMYRKSSMPIWDETLWAAEEYDISLRMAAAGCHFGYVDEYVYCYRMWRGQKSRVTLNRTNADIERFDYIFDLRKKYLDNYKLIER